MLAGGDDVAQLPGGADGEVEFLAGLARIVLDDLRDQAAHRASRDHLEVGGARGRRKERRRDRNQRHETTSHLSLSSAALGARNKLSAIVSRMRRGAIIARCRGNSHGRRDARPQSEVVRERPNYFGGSKPAAVQSSAIVAEVSALMKARR